MNTFARIVLGVTLANMVAAPMAPAFAANSAEILMGARLSAKMNRDHLVRQAALILATEAISDTDGYPLSPSPAAGGALAGGGTIPASSGAPKGDGQGQTFGYCAWDTGSANATAGYLPGAASFGAMSLAVVSPGSDGVYQITCADIASGAAATISGDDYFASYAAGQIMAGVQGSTMVASPVDTQAALAGVTALYDGQVRLVKDQGALYKYSSATGQWSEVGKKTGVAAGTYGSANQMPVISLDEFGRVTSVSTVSVAAGGSTSITAADIAAAQGYWSANMETQIIALDGLSGGGPLTEDVVISLADSGVVAGTYGSSSTMPMLTVDAKGRIVSAANVAFDVSAALGYAPVNKAGDFMTGALSIGVAEAHRMAGSILQVAGGVYADADVNGNFVRVGRGAAGGTGTAVGVNALQKETSGNGNSAFGYQSLFNLATGVHNSAFGVDSLAGTWNGNFNAAFGHSALKANDSGHRNSAFGYQAGKVSTMASDVSAFGHNALAANTASGNSAFGSNALSANTSGTKNSAFGMNALKSSTAAIGNSAFGFAALEANTTGQYNVAVGHWAMQYNTAGANNVAVGSGAMTYNTSGGENTAVGSGALGGNNGGGYNSAFGYRSLTANISGGRNAAFGYGALESNKSSDNSAFGMWSMSSNTTGTLNASFGFEAMRTNSTGSYSAAFGAGALRNTTVSEQSAFGYFALNANTTGARNSAVGFRSLASLTTGADNVALGYKALTSSVGGSWNVAVGNLVLEKATGNSNTAVGDGVMRNTTTGTRNSALGGSALNANTIGSYNSAFGHFAMSFNVDGGYNAAFGSTALQSNTSGNWNTAVGSASLNKNSTGSGNSAVGSGSLGLNTTGANNSAVGNESLYNMIGDNNSAFGNQALKSMTSGSSNIGLGYRAGVNITSGDNNTIIGSLDALASAGALSDTLLIGTGSTERLRADASGLWKFSTTNTATSATPYVYTFCATSACAVGAGGTAVAIGGDANVYANGYVTASDARFKSNVASLDPSADYLQRFMAVRPVGYTLNAVGEYNTGYIAQELQQLFPHMVKQYDASGHLGVNYVQMIPVIHSVVQAQQRQIDAIKSRVQFSADGATVITGKGAAPVEVRSESGARIASFSDAGVALPGHVRLEGVDSSIRFDAGGVAIRADATGALMMDGRPGSGGARLGLSARSSDNISRVMGYLFGDERGVGLSDGEGKALLSALTKDGASTVAINADLVVGDGVNSRISLAGGAAITSGVDGFLDLHADKGIRIFDPVTQKAVITLGSDGVIEARAVKAGRVALTDVVDADAGCAGNVGALARDASGAVMMCVH